ncbi:DUF3187 family protein [bacterium]|nr:DUF3187 family protein [bacterium]
MYTRSQNPLYLQFLAMPIESPQTLKKGQKEAIAHTAFSNIFEYSPLTNTLLNIDMEVWRTAFNFKYGITDEIDVMVEMPFITNSGGFLDGFVQWYHNLFGLPNGGRELVSNNDYHYEITQNGTSLINYPKTVFGFSDITLRVKYLFSDRISLPIKVAWTCYFKIPTGRFSRGLSSGQVDAGFSFLAEKRIKRFHFVTQLGLVVLGMSEDLAAIQKRGLFVFGQSIEFQILNNLSAIIQLTGNTAGFKNVDAGELTGTVADLNVGLAGSFDLKKGWFDTFFYQWSFSEDVLSRGPSVDFSVLFLAGVRY